MSTQKVGVNLFDSKKATTNKRVVVGLDFGTTHSGTAFALTSDGEVVVEPNRNHTFKEPTSLLIKKSNDTFMAYGFDARDQFAQLMTDISEDDGSAKDAGFLFFDGKAIKMRLDNPQAAMCESYDGNTKRPLEKIISLILSHLKDKAIEDIKTRAGVTVKPTDCTWVITVPAIWSDKNKAFMRKCAYNAGLIASESSVDLIMALEPECAGICGNNTLLESKDTNFQNGNRILTVDCGGGTVDIVSMKVSKSPDGVISFSDVKRSGGPWGATCVDDAFKEFVKKLVGRGNFEYVQNNAPQALLELMDEWERAKKKYSESFDDDSFEIKLPIQEFLDYSNDDDVDIKALVEEYNSSCRDEKLKIRAVGRGRNLKVALKASVFRSFFEKSINEIVNCVKSCTATQRHSHLVLAGGYGESRLLKHEIEKKLSGENVEVVVPPKAGAAIMIGAVKYGLQPSVITSRCAAMTFGVGTCQDWDSLSSSEQANPLFQKHKKYDSKLGKNMCHDMFSKYVTVGTTISTDQKVSHTYYPMYTDQSAVGFTILATEKKEVHFSDDPGVETLGSLSVKVNASKNTSSSGLPGIACDFFFGSNEIRVKATNTRDGHEKDLTLQYHDMRLGIQGSSMGANTTYD